MSGVVSIDEFGAVIQRLQTRLDHSSRYIEEIKQAHEVLEQRLHTSLIRIDQLLKSCEMLETEIQETTQFSFYDEFNGYIIHYCI